MTMSACSEWEQAGSSYSIAPKDQYDRDDQGKELESGQLANFEQGLHGVNCGLGSEDLGEYQTLRLIASICLDMWAISAIHLASILNGADQ